MDKMDCRGIWKILKWNLNNINAVSWGSAHILLEFDAKNTPRQPLIYKDYNYMKTSVGMEWLGSFLVFCDECVGMWLLQACDQSQHLKQCNKFVTYYVRTKLIRMYCMS